MPILKLDNVTIRFGGLVAVDGVTGLRSSITG